MKEDYLWDKTGEPDPEIQHLERVLGQLRYQREADKLPEIDDLPQPQARTFSRTLAIAATLAFVALALGAWLALRQSSSQEQRVSPVVAVNLESKQVADKNSVAPAETINDTDQKETARNRKVSGEDSKSTALARRRNSQRQRETYEREQARGEMAKQQLIKALQITTNQLDFVQKKVKGGARPVPSS